jgi:holo-[acyl-carrier protein] synthase
MMISSGSHILGIGTDIVDSRRIEAVIGRHGDRFLRRIFSEAERAYADAASHPKRRIARYANRFAAKEAAFKALGGNVKGIGWQDIAVIHELAGKPVLVFSGMAAEAAEQLTGGRGQLIPHLSLSDNDPYSIAFVVLAVSFSA